MVSREVGRRDSAKNQETAAVSVKNEQISEFADSPKKIKFLPVIKSKMSVDLEGLEKTQVNTSRDRFREPTDPGSLWKNRMRYRGPGRQSAGACRDKLCVMEEP